MTMCRWFLYLVLLESTDNWPAVSFRCVGMRHYSGTDNSVPQQLIFCVPGNEDMLVVVMPCIHGSTINLFVPAVVPTSSHAPVCFFIDVRTGLFL